MIGPKNNPKPLVHFVGIGGIGLSYLARWFLTQNWAVSGSDATKSEITTDLKKDGINVKIGQKTTNLSPRTDLLITSQAIRPENPEIVSAKKLKIPILSFPKIIGRISENYTTIAVAGAHGKSTTTSLVGLMLEKGGLDPTVFVGTKLKEFGSSNGSNFRDGESEYLVLEADEYGKAFLNYSPSIAVLTNIDREHLEIYKDLADIKNNFTMFLDRVRENGAMVLNADDKNIRSLKKSIEKIAKKKNVSVVWYSINDPETKKIKKVIQIPGEHNILNALAAFKTTRFLGVKEKDILETLKNFRGAWRRTELKGTWNGSLIFDDYAHHPTEINATLKGLKEKYPKKELVCVFQPHHAERLEKLFDEFISAFRYADQTIVLPLYKVKGRENGTNTATSERLVASIFKKFHSENISYLDNTSLLPKALKGLPGETSDRLVVMMGAGSIVELTKKLLRS